jgi:hypothetical protein
LPPKKPLARLRGDWATFRTSAIASRWPWISPSGLVQAIGALDDVSAGPPRQRDLADLSSFRVSHDRFAAGYPALTDLMPLYPADQGVGAARGADAKWTLTTEMPIGVGDTRPQAAGRRQGRASLGKGSRYGRIDQGFPQIMKRGWPYSSPFDDSNKWP